MSQYGAYGYALHGASYQSILAHYYRGTALATTNPSRVVRVLLATGKASFSGATAAGSTILKAAQTYTVTALSSGRLAIMGSAGRRVGPTFAAPLAVTGSTVTGSTVTASTTLTVPGVGTYRGALEFRPDGAGGVQTVDAVSLDDYIRGVVASEMPSGWALAALEAQAVAARTYAITTTVGGNGYDLYDDSRSQMYGGVGAETPATDAAVARTRGQIVTYAGQPAVTYFFASSGGYTEDIQNVWPGASPEPWLRGVSDPYDGAGGDPYHQWSEQLGLSAAARRLGRLLKGKLIGITVTQHGASPRIIQASVSGTRGTSTVSGGALQGAFGLLTTYASFTTITTNLSSGRVTGSVFPGRAGTTFWLQTFSSGDWHTVGHAHLGNAGRYRLAVPGPGTYRIQTLHLNGPAVASTKLNAALLRFAAHQQLSAMLSLQRGNGPALPTGRLARYAWPLAGHRRPLRPLPLVLRPARLDHRHR
ncbi:MAG: SpoIID/LytB domain-containing protein [Solirubrobacteraceae bacterium]